MTDALTSAACYSRRMKLKFCVEGEGKGGGGEGGGEGVFLSGKLKFLLKRIYKRQIDVKMMTLVISNGFHLRTL